MYKNFNDWDVYEGFSCGSGRSEKEWIKNKSDIIGLFKFPKSEYTTEHFSEKIASDIASAINLPCAKIDLGVYCNRKGVISYLINSREEFIIEGISLINKIYSDYDVKNLFAPNTKEYYSLEMIMNSLKEFSLEKQFLKIPIFDFLIGNSDRHQNNWAIIKDITHTKLCPVYDNGSSLCCYETEEDLSLCLRDKMKFNALVDSKSKSMIRIDKYKKKKPTHLQVIEYIKDKFYEDTIDFVINVGKILTDNKIDSIMNIYEGYLSANREDVIKKFVKYKVHKLLNVYNIRREEF